MQGDLTRGGKHTIQCTEDVELCTLNPNDFVNQCNPNKKKKIDANSLNKAC